MFYLKWAGAGLFVAALLIMGWTANGWRIRAAEASVLHTELRNELQRRVKADADRLSMQERLQAAEAALARKVETIVQKIHDHAPKTADCNVPVDIADSMSKLRSGQ